MYMKFALGVRMRYNAQRCAGGIVMDGDSGPRYDLHLRIDLRTLHVLRRLAADYSLRVKQPGVYHGRPNVSALIDKLGSGELLLVRAGEQAGLFEVVTERSEHDD